MGTPTNQYFSTIRNTGRGSEVYGLCEVCGNSCSEHHVHTPRHVFVRHDGLRYLNNVRPGRFGHAACLVGTFGPAIDQSTLRRAGNLLVAPT